jgi:uncharacterized protein (DUF885 family)
LVLACVLAAVFTLLSVQIPVSAQTNAETQRLYAFIDGVIYNSWGIYYNIGPGETTRDKWPDYSDEALVRLNSLFQDALVTLNSDFDYDALDYQGKLTHEIFDRYAKQEIKFYEYRLNTYAIDQRNGRHTQLPSNLINYHGINTHSDAVAYITKLDKISDVFDQVIENCERRKLFGCIPPKCIFPAMLETARNVISGYPMVLDSSEFNPLYADFKRKVDAAPIASAQKDGLMVQFEAVLIEDVKPAYDTLISYLEGLEVLAPSAIGVGSMPNGKAYYRMMLNYRTSTDLTPQQVHKLGKQNVRRIRREMKQIMKQVDFPSRKLRDFFEFFRTDKRFYYKNTQHGRKKYIKQANRYLDDMWETVDEMFTVFPLSDLIIKRVEPYREKTALRAWYSSGSSDGTRPGAYYLNLYDMNDQPLYDLEALSYHEGIPGHHFQVSLANEKDFGTYLRPEGSGSTAYIEGWALYTEKMTREFGAYQDPYSDFGRLSMEMLRACRLVVDTGIHYKNWSRQRAIDYIMKHTPETLDNVTAEVDRYAVMTAQATAYMIGKLKIEEIRAAAEAKLAGGFDIKAFHDELLSHGPLPLYLLEDVMEDWSDSIQSGLALHARPPLMLTPREVPQWVIDLRRIKKDDREWDHVPNNRK